MGSIQDKVRELVRKKFPRISEEKVEEVTVALIDMAELALEAALSKQHKQKEAGKK